MSRITYVKFKPKYPLGTLLFFFAQNLFQTKKNWAILYTETTDKNSSFVTTQLTIDLLSLLSDMTLSDMRLLFAWAFSQKLSWKTFENKYFSLKID